MQYYKKYTVFYKFLATEIPMNKKWNRLLYTTMASVLFLGNVQAYGNVVKMRLLYDQKMHNYEAESIHISINGTELPEGDMPPIVLYDRTLVPARAVFEALGAEVAWNEATQEVYVRRENDVVILKADDKSATKNGVVFTMDVPAKVINERTMIPVRAVSEALGCTVGWDENTRMVSIEEEIKQQETPPENNDTDNSENDNNDENNDNNDNNNNNDDDDIKVDVIEKKEYAKGGTGDIPKKDIGVTDIVIPETKQQEQTFIIQASNEIAKFEEIEGKENEIIIDVYYAQKEILTDHIEVETSDVVSGIVSSQYTDDDDITVTRVVLELKRQCEYDIILEEKDEDSIIVSFGEGSSIDTSTEPSENTKPDTSTLPDNNTKPDTSTLPDNNTKPDTNTDVNIPTINTSTNRPNQLKNIHYETTRKAIALSKTELFAINNAEHIDDYLNKKYQIILPEDYSSIYGNGTMTLNTTELVSVTVSQEDGKTALTFEQNGIYAFTITEDANYYYINIKNPKEVYDKILVLDAGHGGQDPGTSGNNLKEKDITLAILQKTYSRLQNTDKVKTYVTRIGDTYPENISRATMANDIGDVFVSIHMNSASPNPTPNGTEVLFITHETDKDGKLTSKAVATTLLKNVVNALGTNNRGLKYDTAEQKNLIVLNRTVVPAVIVETLFLSNPGDALKISNELYQEEVAQAIYDSIIELADNYRWR